MGLFRQAKPRLATVFRRPFECHVCGSHTFFDREVLLNTRGMEFTGLAWANQAAAGLICLTCGYLHLFVGEALELWEEDGGYPEEEE
jgi:hypothetical protein